MRLIHSKTVAGNLVNYWGKIDYLKYVSDIIDGFRKDAREESYTLFDQKYYTVNTKPQLMTADNFKLTVFANRLAHIKNIILNIYLIPLADQKENAEALMNVIEKNYQ